MCKLWSHSPRFLTCGPHRVLCHVLPGQRIPLAKHGMDWLSCICLPGSSGLALGMAVGFVVVTLENRYLGLLRAGRAYRDSPFCPVWGPLPAFQALISTDGRGAMCWGGSRDEHTQNPKEQPLSPLRNPLPGELCGGSSPSHPPTPLCPLMGLTPAHLGPARWHHGQHGHMEPADRLVPAARQALAVTQPPVNPGPFPNTRPVGKSHPRPPPPPPAYQIWPCLKSPGFLFTKKDQNWVTGCRRRCL